jgi:nucleoside-diphosphate-sugar epimerase
MITRFLVTGAQGFVGRYLISRLLQVHGKGVQVLGLGRSSRLDDVFSHSISWGTRPIQAPLPEELRISNDEPRYQYACADIRQADHLSQLIHVFCPHVVIHLASGLRDDPSDFLFRTNVEGTICLVQALADAGIAVSKLVICSTGGVYGIPANGRLPIDESSTCMPVDLYSASKLASEHASRILATRHQIPTIWARLFNIVGAGQDQRHVCGSLAARVAAIVKKQLPPILEVGPLNTTRDFIDVRDVARALILLAERGTPGNIYNVGSGIECPVQSVLDTTLSLAGLRSVEILRKPEFHPQIPFHFADIRRIKALGFDPEYSLNQSLQCLLHYYFETVARIAGRSK